MQPKLIPALKLLCNVQSIAKWYASEAHIKQTASISQGKRRTDHGSDHLPMSWPWHLGDLWSACCVHFTNSFFQEPDFKALFRKATTTGSVFLNLGQSPKFGAIQLLFLEILALNNLLKNPTAIIGIEVLLYSDLTSSKRLHSTHLVLSKCIDSNAVTEWPCAFLSSFWAHILKLHRLTNSNCYLGSLLCDWLAPNLWHFIVWHSLHWLHSHLQAVRCGHGMNCDHYVLLETWKFHHSSRSLFWLPLCVSWYSEVDKTW